MLRAAHELQVRLCSALATQTPTYENLLTRDAAVSQGLADLLLVLIHPCSIDMPKT